MPYLSLSLLGPFQAWTSNGVLQPFRTLKERTLLAYLVVENGRSHRRDALAAMFWPDRPEGVARNNLRQALFGLRQVVGDEGFNSIFSVTADEVRVELSDQIWLDMAAFDVHHKAAQTHRHPAGEPCSFCLQHLCDAVEIYRGSFLEDMVLEKNQAVEEWARARREQYTGLQLQALEALVTEYEQMGDYAQAAFYAARQVRMDDLKEALYRRLMQLLARSGRTAAALEQYDICRRKLREVCGVSLDEQTTKLADQIREGRLEPGAFPRREVPHNLPEQLTPFIGREMELAQVTHCLESAGCRIVSIVGPGGVGKTRLAIQSGLINLNLFPDGVCFVPLDAITSPDQIPEVISRSLGLALGIQEDVRSMLFSYLRARRILLVVDNFEHLMEGSGLLLEILQGAPFVKILITSRERLRLQAEYLIELHGLSFPAQPPASPNADGSGRADIRLAASQSDAVQLLLERAGRVMSNASAAMGLKGRRSAMAPDTTIQLQFAVKICQLVEGLPLGIELAASWAREFSFAQIAAEVERNLEFLQTSFQDVPERHRSLRASFEHSWDLLSESEREVFSKLSVFPGSFSVAAANDVAGAALPWLMQLEDKSLVRRVTFGRYDLHPLIRQFAGLKLSQYARKVVDQVSGQHAQFFCSYLREREQALKGVRQAEALNEIEAEMENIRVAWDWAVDHSLVELLDCGAAALMFFYEARGRWQEGEDRFAKAAQSLQNARAQYIPGGHGQSDTLGYILAAHGWFCCRLTRFNQAEDLIKQSLTLISDQATDKRLFAQFTLGFLYTWMGRFQEALFHLSTCLATAEQVGDAWASAWARELLAEIAFESGQAGYRDQPFLETLALFERSGDQRGGSRALNYLGNIALAQGRLAEARVYFEKLLSTAEKLGDVWGSSGGYTKLGQLAAVRGDYEQAWRLHQRSLSMLQRIGDQRRTAFAQRELGEVAWALNKRAEARDYFRQALDTAARLHSLPLAQDILTGFAAVMLQDPHRVRTAPADWPLHEPGQGREKTLLAAQLLLILTAETVSDQLTASRARRLLENAQALLPPGQIDQARQLVHSQTIWDYLNKVLAVGLDLLDE